MIRNAALLAVALVLFIVAGQLPFAVDVSALIVVYLALERSPVEGAAMAGAVGYLADVFAGTPRGLYATAMVLLFFLVRVPMARIAGERLPLVTLVATVSALSSELVLALLMGTVGGEVVRLEPIAAAVPSLVLSAGLFGYPLVRLLRAIDARLGEPEEEPLLRG